MIKYANLLMIVGIVMCMFPFNDWYFAFARFVWGLAVGAFTVFVPKFITETSPTEMSGLLGGASQLLLCSGILIPSLLSLAVPNETSGSTTPPGNFDFYTNMYWRYTWLLAVLIALLQLLALSFCFNYETPLTLKENGEWDKLTALMRRIYKADAVQSRVLAI
jgi:MFS family permease